MNYMVKEHIPFATDDGVGSVARIGLVVLATDYTMEHEYRTVLDVPGIGVFHARIHNDTVITPESLADMGQRISETVGLILPGDKLDVVAYGCTSATTVMGEEAVFDRIRAVQPDAKCTTPITAAFAAFDAMKAKRIAVLTPYRRDVNAAVQQYIENAGYTVPVFGSFNEENDPVVARIDAESISNAIDQIIEDQDIDMVFVSCTSVRLVEVAPEIEKRIGIPVTSSNHAMIWHCLRLAGHTDAMPQWGRLYEKQIL